MNKHIDAEVVILDRIMYLLEEGSVSHLLEQDASFRSFVHDLFQQLNDHSRHLQMRLA
jgi:hypothetical protein